MIIDNQHVHMLALLFNMGSILMTCIVLNLRMVDVHSHIHLCVIFLFDPVVESYGRKQEK